ncbi:MAG: hypothetical protein ACPGPH_03470 [Synechococcus sp.]
MSSCDDLFQRKLALDLQRQENDAELVRLKQIRASRDLPSDEQFQAASDDALANMADPANRAAAEEAIATQQANPGKVAPKVNIGEGQPVNFQQRLRDQPEEVVRDYAILTNSLRQAGVKNMPDEFVAAGYTSPKQRARYVQDLFARGNTGAWLRTMANADERFIGLVDDATVIRFAHDTAKDVYAKSARDVLTFVRENPGAKLPDEQAVKLFRQFKVALMAQRHYDTVRTAWGRLGQALQGKGFEGPLQDFVDPELINAVGAVADEMSQSAQAASVEAAGKLTPDQLTADQSFSEILSALDKAQTNPTAAVEQLEIAVKNIRIEGAERRMESAQKIQYNRFKRFNLLTKDWQLFNERTNFLNFGSNSIMALFGPYRQFYEDLMQFREVQGTSISRAATQAWAANYEGLGAAALAVRDAGKEVFVDAFRDGKAMYANNVDTYGKRFQPPEELEAELVDIQKAAIKGAQGKGPHRRIASLANPERYGRYFHTGFRLWMFEKTGDSFWLRPGLRTMSAADNVAGFFHSVYKVRHELEMKARLQGKQMNFEEAADPQRAMDDWIEQQFNESFYSMQPTEAQRIAFRREQGIPAEMLDDQRIDDLIMETRVSEKYGGMVPNAATRAASNFSDEMRFANIPGEPGGPIRGLYMGGKGLQQQPLVEAVAPYFQAPFLGVGFDPAMTGLPGIARLMTDMTPEQARRNKANMIMAGHVWAMWGLLSAGGLIVGNGPVDKEQRREWLIKLKAKGLEPNSIAGVPLRGGYPIINTIFLMEDIKQNVEGAFFSKYDQLSVVEAVTGVLLGYLSRGSAIGQVQQLMEVAYADRGMGSKLGGFAGYIAGGRYLPSGPMRSLERISNSQSSDLYRDGEWNEKDYEDIPHDQMETWERYLRETAYNVSGLAGAFGGKYKDKDWLGTDIRKPWGMDLLTYLQNRFTPVEHPNDKVYAELDYLDLLDPPKELIAKRLRDVPMTDDMQKFWNDSYGQLRGTTHPYLVGTPATYSIRLPLMDITDKTGLRFQEDLNLWTIDMRLFLGKHTEGKTMLEAARSLMNDPIYKAMEDQEPTSFSTDAPAAERRRKPAAVMMLGLKRYYAEMTTTQMLNMQDPPPEVARWREMEQAKNATLQQQMMNESGKAPITEEAEAQMEALREALGGAQ